MEMALSDDEIERGLMGRQSLPPHTGMLFVFPDVRPRQFWMAWCVMPIDVVFMDGRGRIVATHAMPVEPPQQEGESDMAYLNRIPSWPSGVPVRFAAEFPQGTIDRLHLERGDKIELDIAHLLDLSKRRN